MSTDNSLGAVRPFTNDGEAVYAVMVTGKDPRRVPLALVSVQCFLAQSYGNRILIIVDDSASGALVDNAFENRVRHVRPEKGMSLGELRNIGLTHIPQGGLYLQWDDDDWHGPDLIRLQKAFMESNALDGCALQEQVKYDLNRNSAWDHRLPPELPGFAGSVMVHLNEIRYPAMRAHEDSMFWSSYIQRYHVAAYQNFASDYIRLIHSSNTSSHLSRQPCEMNCWMVKRETESRLKQVMPLYGVAPGRLRQRMIVDGAPWIGA